jgi:peptidylprolyl isomerase
MRLLPFLALTLLLTGSPSHGQALAPELLQAPAGGPVTTTGLVTQVLHPGQGTERPGPKDFVTVQYTIWKADGSVFQDTAKEDGPVSLCLERVMKGMGEGLQLMTEGEQRRLWIPAELGFPAGRGLPTGRLVMDLELRSLDLKPGQAPEDVAKPGPGAVVRPSGLAYRSLRQGTGTKHPGRRDTVNVHYSGWTTDGKLFDSSILRRTSASLRLDEVIKGWTEGIQLMVKGDRMRFWIPEKLAYKGEDGKPAGTLVFDVELLGFW